MGDSNYSAGYFGFDDVIFDWVPRNANESEPMF